MKQLLKITLSAIALGLSIENKAMTIESLKDDVLETVFSFCTDKDLSSYARVNKDWRRVVENMRAMDKAAYPITALSAETDSILKGNGYLERILPTVELANRLRHRDKATTLSIKLTSDNGIYIPKQLALFKKLRNLYLKMPKQSDCIENNFSWEIAQSDLEEATSRNTHILLANHYLSYLSVQLAASKKNDSVIALHKLIDELPDLTKLTLIDDKNKEYLFKDKEKIKDLQAKLKKHRHNAFHTTTWILQEFYQ